jgi:hypothetical protein
MTKGERKELSQSEKFISSARKHGADESVKRWDERMKKIAKAKPEKPE